MTLGGPNLALAQLAGAASNKAAADKFAANVMPIIRQAQAAGANSLRAIAEILNARGGQAKPSQYRLQRPRQRAWRGR